MPGKLLAFLPDDYIERLLAACILMADSLRTPDAEPAGGAIENVVGIAPEGCLSVGVAVPMVVAAPKADLGLAEAAKLQSEQRAEQRAEQAFGGPRRKLALRSDLVRGGPKIPPISQLAREQVYQAYRTLVSRELSAVQHFKILARYGDPEAVYPVGGYSDELAANAICAGYWPTFLAHAKAAGILRGSEPHLHSEVGEWLAAAPPEVSMVTVAELCRSEDIDPSARYRAGETLSAAAEEGCLDEWVELLEESGLALWPTVQLELQMARADASLY